MIQKKRRLHLSYSQAFGVALPTDKFRPRYSAGVHLIYCWEIHLLIAKFREYSEYRKRYVYEYIICLCYCSFCFLFLILIVQHDVMMGAVAAKPSPLSLAKIQNIFDCSNLAAQNILNRVDFA